MDDLQSEKEQLEEMRAWWAEYGRYVIAGVVIAVGLLFGFNQYKSSKLAAQVEASELFEALAGHVFDGDLDDAEVVADELANNYANTTYAAQSKLAMARLYMDKNRDQDAADILNELLTVRGSKVLKHVGRLRLARVLLYQDKPQEVIDLLADQENEAFAGLYAEMRGDALAALGQVDAAADAYRIALANTSQTVNRGLVQMKLLDLPDALPAAPEDGVPEAGAPEPDAVIEPDAEPISDDEAGEAE
ncbi:MAG: tetratricopeptide repeat protein [Gammaproteobacteria bacterium]|nr:tetratricopeptide repeat protein [Gammaproteobacteria bacterium]MDH3805675.1 tetratricopeptide repeat protein [Gammaproteobacteria bacterium]